MTDKIAFQGILGSYSSMACQDYYPDMEKVACPTFTDVFDAVEKGDVKYGMIPLENSYAGRVSEIHNLLKCKEVSIVAEHFQEIRHHLVGLAKSDIDNIKEVYSHPQALMQCGQNLKEYNFKLHDCSNTAVAAKKIAEMNDISKAAICSEMAANTHGLKIIKNDLQDIEDNTTVFVVIAKNAIHPQTKSRPIITTLLFTIRNIPASLYKSLGGFATNNINMIKIESYIPGGFSNQAEFFISFLGSPEDRSVNLALEELGFFSKKVKVLGVYHADKKRIIEIES